MNTEPSKGSSVPKKKAIKPRVRTSRNHFSFIFTATLIKKNDVKVI